jgi:SpoVK/Ycf46/Vps4 family AAA+-type ATPase
MIEVELQNLEILQSKKGKKKKKTKKKKPKKKKPKKLPPALKLIAKKTTYELLNELFVLGIAKKIKKQHLITDFQGEYNFIGSVLEDPKEMVPDASLAQVRNAVVEWGILPLGSKAVHEFVERREKPIKSMLFLGPQGTGKTMLAKTIAYQTSSLFLDISPTIIENTYPEKKGEDKLVATVMRVAKELQPAVIYIDECEMVFPSKKKKKGKKKEKKGKGPSRIKKTLDKLKKTYLKKNDRVLIIGCTNTCDEMSDKEAEKFFEVKIYFPYPDVLNRKSMWDYMIKNLGGVVTPQFAMSTLAHITEGYSAGSIRHSCEKVLTNERKKCVIL